MCIECVPTLEGILWNMRNQNSGADIHEVQTIRHIAAMLISRAKSDPEYVCRATVELSKRQNDFFVKKYSRLRY